MGRQRRSGLACLIYRVEYRAYSPFAPRRKKWLNFKALNLALCSTLRREGYDHPRWENSANKACGRRWNIWGVSLKIWNSIVKCSPNHLAIPSIIGERGNKWYQKQSYILAGGELRKQAAGLHASPKRCFTTSSHTCQNAAHASDIQLSSLKHGLVIFFDYRSIALLLGLLPRFCRVQ